jgi:hypothetical protein
MQMMRRMRRMRGPTILQTVRPAILLGPKCHRLCPIKKLVLPVFRVTAIRRAEAEQMYWVHEGQQCCFAMNIPDD